MFVARSYHVYFRHLSVEYRPTLSADTRPISWPMIDRHLGRHSGEISTDTWSNVGRHVLQVGRPSIARLSIDTYRSLSVDTYRSTPIDRHLSVDTYRSSIGRYLSVEYRPILSADTWPISRPILDRHLGRYSTDISTDTSSSVGRHVLQVSRPSVTTISRYLVDMSVYTRPTPRPLRYDEL